MENEQHFNSKAEGQEELIQMGFQKIPMNGITARDGVELMEGDVIETVQGTKFYCVNHFGIRTNIIDQEGNEFFLESYMSPNIWKIGSLWENPDLRIIFKRVGGF